MGETRVTVVGGVGGLSAAAHLADAGWDGHFAQISGERYNATKGTALGLAHTLRQTALVRPSNRSETVDELYFTGAYTTPGIGIPMCLIGGEHTAAAVLEAQGER